MVPERRHLEALVTYIDDLSLQLATQNEELEEEIRIHQWTIALKDHEIDEITQAAKGNAIRLRKKLEQIKEHLSDRLERIRSAHGGRNTHTETGVCWLISEVERLRGELATTLRDLAVSGSRTVKKDATICGTKEEAK